MNKKVCFLLLTLIFQQVAFSQTRVTATKVGDKIDIKVNGNLFTSYILSAFEKYPFFFPVNGPSNASVTSMRNANYPHHSSLFFGCDRVNEGNYWQEGLERGQIISLRADITETGGEKAVIVNECIWRRPGADAPIKDKRIITITAPTKEKYVIDFDVTMEMLMDVEIGKTNHSLFSARVDPDLAVINGGTMINAEGETGEKATFGKRSPWMDCHGERLGKKEGIAILQHPSNDWYPAPWFTRDYGFFSPTPMYWPENDEHTILKKGEFIQLRYRVVVHTGDHLQAGIVRDFKAYASE